MTDDDHRSSSPYARSHSPSFDVSPTAALSPCPPLERSTSTSSSVDSSFSSRSTSGQLSDGGNKRRGYMRPHATVFADSARNRDSVMSLGTITHLQHYFARTGLLDGKGAQFAKEQNKDEAGIHSQLEFPSATQDAWHAYGTGYEPPISHSGIADDSYSEVSDHGNPSEWDDTDVVKLPPTYSTYKHKPTYVPPPPDLTVLRRELREALEDSSKLLAELDQSDTEAAVDVNRNPGPRPTTPRERESNGWYEIQGLRVLDLVTLAIRAAKNYYTAHDQPQRLYAIKSERRIRSDLYAVLDVLKRMATRNFAGGVRKAERLRISEWISSIEDLLLKEQEKETEEREQRERWTWRDGDWSGRERERELLFLESFDSATDSLPQWTEPTNDQALPTPFLAALQTGLRLVHLHNNLVRASKRQFEEIKSFHVDTAKPYRCAENLRYWVKAAELRFDLKLDVNVSAIVQGTDPAAWKDFDSAILQWCRAVRTELTSEFNGQKVQPAAEPPVVQIEQARVSSV